jgi:hypothetical protein
MKQIKCDDPRFLLVLTDSKFMPGTKAWKLVRVEDADKKETS